MIIFTDTNDIFSDDIHVGKYFAFAIPDVHWDGDRYEFVVTIDAVVHVVAPAANLNTTDTIAVGTSKRYDLFPYDMEVSEGEESGKAIIVNSDNDVKVEVIVTDDRSQAAAFLALPVQPHFTQFVAAAYFNPGTFESRPMVIVVATEPDTTVEFYR